MVNVISKHARQCLTPVLNPTCMHSFTKVGSPNGQLQKQLSLLLKSMAWGCCCFTRVKQYLQTCCCSIFIITSCSFTMEFLRFRAGHVTNLWAQIHMPLLKCMAWGSILLFTQCLQNFQYDIAIRVSESHNSVK